MRNLLLFFTRYNHWLLFILLEVVSGVLLFQYNSYQGSVWFSTANSVIGKLYETDSKVRSFFSLSRVNEELSQRNFYLERQVDLLRTKIGDLTGDTTKTEREGLDFLKRYQLIAAKVITNSVSDPDNLMTIDKGAADGVKPDMGVACGNGVVGVVYLVGEHYSIVIPVLNVTSSRISCSIRGRGYFGYLHWDGKDPAFAYVDDIPRHAKFKRGEWVETSGYSSIFPHGVLAGRIEKVFNSADGLSYRLQIRLSTDFGCLRDVFVITESGNAERMELMKAARDSLTLKTK